MEVHEAYSRSWNIESLVRDYQKYVLIVVRFYIRKNTEEVKDCCQRVWIKIIEGLEGFNGGDIKSWIGRIAKNEALNTLRDLKTQGRGEQHYGRHMEYLNGYRGDRPDWNAERREIQSMVRAAVTQLPITLRGVLEAQDIYDRPPAEVAENFNIGIDVVRLRRKRGREKLKRIFRRQQIR